MKQWHALWIAALGFAIILAGFYIHPLEEPAVAAEEGSDRNEGTAGPAMDKNVDGTADEREDQADISDDTDANEHAGEHINHPPVEPKIRRDGNIVFIEMTAQVTDVEISRGITYHAWTFNGTVPGPVLRVKEGDTLVFTLRNHDPENDHSMDFHAVHAAPNRKFIDVAPHDERTFTYTASSPGVFMYHCGTDPILEHIANGMYGTIIVEPKDGYPSDHEVDREYVLVQSEWYAEHDMEAFLNEEPEYVMFNGNDYGLKEHPLTAKVGDTVRIYVSNAGPNHTSSFHVVGTIFDRVYIDGHPDNMMHGMQTVLLPASGGAVVEFTVKEAGDYPIVSHQFNHATKGAVAILRVTEDDPDEMITYRNEVSAELMDVGFQSDENAAFDHEFQMNDEFIWIHDHCGMDNSVGMHGHIRPMMGGMKTEMMHEMM